MGGMLAQISCISQKVYVILVRYVIKFSVISGLRSTSKEYLGYAYTFLLSVYKDHYCECQFYIVTISIYPIGITLTFSS